MVVHFAAVLITSLIFYRAWPGSSLFSFHPSLMTLGFAFLSIEAVLVFSPSSSLLRKSSWNARATSHWILQSAAALSLGAGLFSIIYNKELHEAPHFTTWHGLAGIGTVVVFVIGLFGGVAALYPSKFAPPGWSAWHVRRVHSTGGLFLFLAVTVTFHLAFFSTWFAKNFSTYEWVVCVGCVSAIALSVMTQVTQKYMRKTTGSKSVRLTASSSAATKSASVLAESGSEGEFKKTSSARDLRKRAR